MTRPTPTTSSRPIWVPVPLVVRLRRCFAFAAVTGVLAAVVHLFIIAGEDSSSPLLVAAMLVPALLTVAGAILSLHELLEALESGPGDDMSVYGSGRTVEVSWQGTRRSKATVFLGDGGAADVHITPSTRRGAGTTVALRIDGRTHHLRRGPTEWSPTWFTLLDPSGRRIAGADAASRPRPRRLLFARFPVDWEIQPSRGPILRLRHDHFGSPERITLLDPTGTAWSVRDGAHAELPDELDPIDALFVVVMVELLRRQGLTRNSARLH